MLACRSFCSPRRTPLGFCPIHEGSDMAEQTEIADLITSIKADVTTIVRGEVALAADDLKPEAAKVGVIAGMFGTAGYLGLMAITVLFNAVGFAWSIGFQHWFNTDLLTALFFGFTTAAVVLLLVAALLALVGSKWPKPAAPKRIVQSTESHLEVVKAAISEARAEAAALPLDGRTS